MNTLTLGAFPSNALVQPEGVSLLGLPAERSAKRSLPGSADDILKTIASILDGMLLEVISKRTAAEFSAAVDDAFPKYVNLVWAFAKLAAAVVRPQTIQRLAHESYAELEADLRDQGLSVLGESLRERGVFTVWTLRKTADLLTTLERAGKPVATSSQEKDVECHERFLINALRSRFHIDCLITSMRTERPLYPEVLPLIDDGLRSAVNAYAWIKQAVDLRFPSDESEAFPTHWTADDDELLQASMDDLDRHDIE